MRSGKKWFTLPTVPSIRIVYATTSGHTEYVVKEIQQYAQAKWPQLSMELKRAETAASEDLSNVDLLILATSSWNTGNVEGQLNPHMFHFLMDIAKDVKLNGQKVAAIGLGDERYFYTCKAADHLEDYIKTHGGTLLQPTLRIINEPYGQEEKFHEWADTILHPTL